MTKKAGMLTLGYTCEYLEMSNYPDHRDSVVGAILFHFSSTDQEMQKMALRTLGRAGVISKEQFQCDEKRKFMMENIFNMLKTNDTEIHSLIVGILNDIVYVIYPYVDEYLQKIGDETMALINEVKKGDDTIKGDAVKVIDFWVNICSIDKSMGAGGKNLVKQIYEAILKLAITAIETELTEDSDKDINDEDDVNFNRSIAISGLDLARSVISTTGLPAYKFLMNHAKNNYFPKNDWKHLYCGIICVEACT
jgi:hypothetical protein